MWYNVNNYKHKGDIAMKRYGFVFLSYLKFLAIFIFIITLFASCGTDDQDLVDVDAEVNIGDTINENNGTQIIVNSGNVFFEKEATRNTDESKNQGNNILNDNVNSTTTISTITATADNDDSSYTKDEHNYDSMTSLIGVWSGDYISGEIQRNLDLTIYSHNGNRICAIFSFNNSSDEGSYFMTGNVINKNEIKLMGEQWIDRPSGYTFVDINGVISYTDMSITDDSTSLYIEKVSDDIGSIPQKKEISNEGYLSSLNPYRTDGINDYMINNNYRTHTGDVYPNGFVATSGGSSPDHVISVCSYSPFELIYNLEKKYTHIQGKVGFDDISVSSTDLFGVGSFFQGTATITFISGDKELDSLTLSTSDIPKEFDFSVNQIDQLIIKVNFPYSNFVTDNFNKFFNFIDVKLE